MIHLRIVIRGAAMSIFYQTSRYVELDHPTPLITWRLLLLLLLLLLVVVVVATFR